jgi:hypothetical protein
VHTFVKKKIMCILVRKKIIMCILLALLFMKINKWGYYVKEKKVRLFIIYYFEFGKEGNIFGRGEGFVIEL